MRFLVHGNSPHVKTGYGVQVAHLCDRLTVAGHDVAVSSTYGQQGGVGTWVSPSTGQPVMLYPPGYEVNGNQLIHLHALHHFNGEALGGWLILVIDVWVMQQPALADLNVAAWVPVDHFPVPPDVLKFFHRTGATPIAMSRFGERLLFDAGLDPVYIPLSVDTGVYKPTPTLTVNGVERSARDLLDLPDDAFVVGMVAMNKGWARDRKGFNEAFRAFGQFWKNHQDAVLFLHTEKYGAAEGINLPELLQHASVPEHAVRWADQYAYMLGTPSEVMAATYTAMDVLLAPSHGEGFCVPLIEAQACGTPVIATDATAQPELVGAGWLVGGQAEWDPAQHASYVVPSIGDIVGRLEEAYQQVSEHGPQIAAEAISFAAQYDTERVFVDYWRPFLDTLEPAAPVVRPPMEDVAVIVPAMRAENLSRLVDSFHKTKPSCARLVIVAEDGAGFDYGKYAADVYTEKGSTFAEKVNAGYAATTESFVLVVGDDVEFKPGWYSAAKAVSEHADVIGTNDTDGPVKNPDVAAGRHADHFFVRRSYIESDGACLDGPGHLIPTAYQHWYTDKEVVGLARARGVFVPCLESVVVHHHPGYEGREDLRQADPVYMRAVEHAEVDAKTYRSRLPLIEMQRTTRAKVR